MTKISYIVTYDKHLNSRELGNTKFKAIDAKIRQSETSSSDYTAPLSAVSVVQFLPLNHASRRKMNPQTAVLVLQCGIKSHKET